jgi:hypothetical protein
LDNDNNCAFRRLAAQSKRIVTARADWLLLAGDVGETKGTTFVGVRGPAITPRRLIWVLGNHELDAIARALA